MLQDLMREMFGEMVGTKDKDTVEKYYDPAFVLHSNGYVQDYPAFHAGHAHVYQTPISYTVEYDEQAWQENAERLGGRVWITTERPGEPATKTEVIFLAEYRDRRILRLWELTWPDWSQLGDRTPISR